MGGTDDRENICVLTYREHYIAHLLLTKVYPKHRGINYALLCMIRKQPTGERIYNSRIFHTIKSNFSKFKKYYCTIQNPGKSEKSRTAARKRMTERNPISLDPSKNRTAQPIRVYYYGGDTEDYVYAKELSLKKNIPYGTIKYMLKHNVGSKKHNIERLERKETKMTRKVVRYTATWCSPCKVLANILNSVKTEVPIEVIDIDTEEGRTLSEKNKVRSVPTMIMFEDDVEVKRMTGLQPIDNITNWFNTK